MSTPTSAVTAPAPVPALFTGAKTSTSLRDRLAAQTLADGHRPTDAARPCADDGRPPLAAPPHLADTPVAAHAGLPDERLVNAASGDENVHEAIADGQRPTDAARPCADDGRPPLAAPPHLADTPMAAHVGLPDERPVNAASGDENEHEAMGHALFCALSVLPTPPPPRQSAPLGRDGLADAATASPDRPHPVPNAVHDTVTERSPVLQAAMRRPSRSTVSWLPSVVAEPMAHRGGAHAVLRGSHRVVATVSGIPMPHVGGSGVAHVGPMNAVHGQAASAIARAEPMPAPVPVAPVTPTAVPAAPVTPTAVPAAPVTPTAVPAAPDTPTPAAQAATVPLGPVHPDGPAAATGRPPALRRFEPADVQPSTASHRAAASTRTAAQAATAQHHNEQTTARMTERALPAAPVDTSTRITVPFTSYGPGHQVTAQWGGGTPGLRLHSSSERSHRAVVVAVEQSGVPGHEGLQVEATRSMDDDTPSPRRQHLLPHEEEA